MRSLLFIFIIFILSGCDEYVNRAISIDDFTTNFTADNTLIYSGKVTSKGMDFSKSYVDIVYDDGENKVIDINENGFIYKTSKAKKKGNIEFYFFEDKNNNKLLDKKEDTVVHLGRVSNQKSDIHLDANVVKSEKYSLNKELTLNLNYKEFDKKISYLYIDSDENEEVLIKLDSTKYTYKYTNTKISNERRFYFFEDSNNNGKFDAIDDKVVHLFNSSLEDENSSRNIKISHVYGQINNSEALKLNRFDFIGTHPPLLKIENTVDYDEVYQRLDKEGKFDVLVSDTDAVNVVIVDMSSSIINFKKQYLDSKYHTIAVQLIAHYQIKAALHVKDNNSKYITLHPFKIKFKNEQTSTATLVLEVGELSYGYKIYDDNNKALTAITKEAVFTTYLREYNQTIAQDGLLNQFPENSNSNFSLQIYYDENSNFEHDDNEVSSDIYTQSSMYEIIKIQSSYTPSKSVKDWMSVATIGGLSVDRGDENGTIIRLINDLVDQNVSVIEFDSALSMNLSEEEFEQELKLMKRSSDYAKSKNLRSVWYYPALEVITKGGEKAEHSMAKDHPDWLQVDAKGDLNVFYGSKVFWVEEGDESAWMEPLSPWRDFIIERIKKMALSGIDAVWLDVPLYSDIVAVWPSHHQLEKDKFRADTGFEIPQLIGDDKLDFSSQNTRAWFYWRHLELDKFLKDILKGAREVNPDFNVIVETVTMDYNAAFRQGLDGSFAGEVDGLWHVWEVDVLSDYNAMRNGKYDDFISLIAMYKYAKGADSKKASWAFTYGLQEDDAEAVLAIATTAGVSPYELKSPEMTTTVGHEYRKKMFSFIRKHENIIFRSKSRAKIALIHSSSSRDYVDGECLIDGSCGTSLFATTSNPNKGKAWWAEDEGSSLYSSKYMAEYRGMLKLLVDLHVPFDLLSNNTMNLEKLQQYEKVFLPYYKALSQKEYEILDEYVKQGGNLIFTAKDEIATLNEKGMRTATSYFPEFKNIQNEGVCKSFNRSNGKISWCNENSGKNYLLTNSKKSKENILALMGDSRTNILDTTAKKGLYFESYVFNNTIALEIVNFSGADGDFKVTEQTFDITLDVGDKTVTSLVLSTPHTQDKKVNFTQIGEKIKFKAESISTWSIYTLDVQ